MTPELSYLLECVKTHADKFPVPSHIRILLERVRDEQARLTERVRDEQARLTATLAPLVKIADAYDENALDDEARRWWGPDESPTYDTTPPERIELYSGRGGRQLLTLADCLAARAVATGGRS